MKCNVMGHTWVTEDDFTLDVHFHSFIEHSLKVAVTGNNRLCFGQLSQ